MIMNLIFLFCMYPILFLIYFVMKNTAKSQNGIVFGSVMKKEWLAAPEMKEIEDRFYREMKRYLIVLAIVPVLAFLTTHVSIQLTIWMCWLLGMIVILNLPLIHANHSIRELKQEKGWYEASQKTEYVEMKAAGNVRKVHIGAFLPPMLLSVAAALAVYLIPAAQSESFLNFDRIAGFRGVVVLFALITLFFYPVAVWMDRQKTQVISSDSNVNINYARAKKNVWKNFWLEVTWYNAIYTVVVAVALLLELEFAAVALWGAVIYACVAILLAFPLMRKMQAVEKAYQQRREAGYESEDDKYWLWGTLYYNPQDTHTFVNKRVGVGTTINMATPAGKAWTVVTAVALLSIPILCAWMIFEEFMPIELSVAEGSLKAYHLKVDYEIPVEEIEELSLIEELPNWTKLNGSAMENLDKGTFSVRGVGKCETFLNPQNAVFLTFQADGMTYYMSGIDDEETMEVYELLTGSDATGKTNETETEK